MDVKKRGFAAEAQSTQRREEKKKQGKAGEGFRLQASGFRLQGV